MLNSLNAHAYFVVLICFMRINTNAFCSMYLYLDLNIRSCYISLTLDNHFVELIMFFSAQLSPFTEYISKYRKIYIDSKNGYVMREITKQKKMINENNQYT